MNASRIPHVLAAIGITTLLAASCGAGDELAELSEAGAAPTATTADVEDVEEPDEPADDASSPEPEERDGDNADDSTDEASSSEGETEPLPEEPTPSPSDAGGSEEASDKPSVAVPEEPPPTDLVTTDIVTGEGTVAQSGDVLIVDYVGVLYSTGEQFDASWDRGQPFVFQLGIGQVIQGWDDGMVGMAVGGRRELIIPPDQAYGDQGSGSGSIGPGETLIFVVDLLGVVPQDLTKPQVDNPETPLEGETTEVTDIVVGEGAVAEAGSTLWLHYVGVAQSTGEEFDSSWDRGPTELLSFPVGTGQVIPGFDEGLLGMRVGGRRQLVIPPAAAYGETGAGGVIGPNETLVFVVDLIAIT